MITTKIEKHEYFTFSLFGCAIKLRLKASVVINVYMNIVQVVNKKFYGCNLE